VPVLRLDIRTRGRSETPGSAKRLTELVLPSRPLHPRRPKAFAYDGRRVCPKWWTWLSQAASRTSNAGFSSGGSGRRSREVGEYPHRSWVRSMTRRLQVLQV
jgi:hypothetical protein